MTDLTAFQQANGGAAAGQFMDGGGFNAGGQYVAPVPPASTPTQPGAPATPAAPVTNPVVGTSTNYRADINNLGNNINNGLNTNTVQELFGQADTTGLNDSYAANQKLIQNRQDELAKRRDSELQSINTSFDLERQKTETAQRKETGTTSTSLAHMGGYLGDSASAQGV